MPGYQRLRKVAAEAVLLAERMATSAAVCFAFSAVETCLIRQDCKAHRVKDPAEHAAWERRDVLSFPVAVQRLKAAAEAAKIALSSQTSTRVVIPDLLPGEAVVLRRVATSTDWLQYSY